MGLCFQIFIGQSAITVSQLGFLGLAGDFLEHSSVWISWITTAQCQVCRVAPSFIRFGHFELFESRDDYDLLRALATHTLQRYGYC